MSTTEAPKLVKGQKFTLKCLRTQRTGKSRGRQRVVLLAVAAEGRPQWDDELQAWIVRFQVPGMSFFARYDYALNIWYEGKLTEESIKEVLAAQSKPSAL